MVPQFTSIALCCLVNDGQRPVFHQHLPINIIRKPSRLRPEYWWWDSTSFPHLPISPTLVSLCLSAWVRHSHRLWPPLSSRLPLRSKNLSISQGPAIRGLDCGKLIHNHTVLRAFLSCRLFISTCEAHCWLIYMLPSQVLPLFPTFYRFLFYSLSLASFKSVLLSLCQPIFFATPPLCSSTFFLNVMPITQSQHGIVILFLWTADQSTSAVDWALQITLMFMIEEMDM